MGKRRSVGCVSDTRSVARVRSGVSTRASWPCCPAGLVCTFSFLIGTLVPNYKGSGFDFQVQSGGSTLIGSFPTGCAICSYTDFATTGNNASATINLRSAQVTPANRWASALGVLFFSVN